MRLIAKNHNVNSFAVSKNSENNLCFTGFRTGKINHHSAIKKISHCHLGEMHQTLALKVGGDFIQGDTFKKPNAFLETISYPFTKMWKGWLNSFSEKFNLRGLYDSKLLTDFRAAAKKEKYERALRGFFENGDAFIDNAARKKEINLKNIDKLVCENGCRAPFSEICEDVTNDYFKLFDDNFAKTKAKYNTPHERTLVKIVSGSAAAMMMGNDFYNKSILNGMSKEEAEKSKNNKLKQELIESGQEAASQYLMLGSFSEFTNNHTLASPILNTILSTIFRITSRISTGRPLTRIKVPERTQVSIKVPSMDGFLDSVKNNKPVEFKEIKSEKRPENKEHILSLKNIGLACLASIGMGFALKGAKSTKVFKNVKKYVAGLEPIRTLNKRIRKLTVGEVWVSEKELNSFYDVLFDSEFSDFEKYFKDYKLKNPKLVKNGKIFLGEYEKMSTIPFTKIQVSNKELLEIPIMPFKMILEFASYPYKAASKILEGICGSKKVKESLENLDDTSRVKKVIRALTRQNKKPELKNDYNILNTYMDFQEELKKYGGEIDDKFIEEYGKRFEDNILSALNKETKSNVNNAAIGKLTSLFGLFASLYFSMTDDFNETIKQTGDKQKAEKDARLRGLNKVIRTSVQCVFLSLNDLFKIPYNSSLLGAGLITAACTVLTDSVSRILSGMPFRKMDKEELQEYNSNKKEGVLKGYYNMLDKLTD